MIELLAVIVILAVISLITTPLIMDVIETNKRNLTIEYRKIYKKLFDDEFLDEKLIKKRFNKDLDVVEMKKNILKNYKVLV